MQPAKRFSSYTFGEARTAGGQLVNFTCSPEEKGAVRQFFETKVCSLDLPASRRVSTEHGGYGNYSRYSIKQHKYAGGGGPGCGGYIEVLQIFDPPDDRWGIVIHEHNSHRGNVFTEWDTLEQALAVFEKHSGMGTRHKEDAFDALPGFRRRVVCGPFTPWFYAIGDETLLGDLTFPDGFQDDPVYRFGRKFLVHDENGIPSVKTCFGTRLTKNTEHVSTWGSATREVSYRLVYFDDGAIWDERQQSPYWSMSKYPPPRPLEENELWIAEAMQQFRELLAGRKTEFSIRLLDGSIVTTKVKTDPRQKQRMPGRYHIVLTIVGEKEPREGWVDFEPTPETPDVITYVEHRYLTKGKTVERIEIKRRETPKGGKKWAGVFLGRSPTQ